ncbi:S41 family peptidase [Nonomuraea sp. NPDC047529]|uniref:S41 family peptidase n=1 Tax=Nonomuraea sp. NPDC047529 TaxID=3155623 RepID=UPI0033E811AC
MNTVNTLNDNRDMKRGRTSRRLAAVLAALGIVVAGQAAAPPADAAARRQPLDGLWQADGYGTVVSIGQGRLTTHDTTAISCLPGVLSAEQTAATRDSASFTARAGGRRIIVQTRGSGRARLRYPGSVGAIGLRRLPRLPGACSTPTSGDPVRVFDVFWTTFAENYPFFATKGVDWRAVRDRYRPKVSSNTGDEELFAVLRDILKELGDAHTALLAGGRQFARPLRPGTRQLDGIPAFLAFNARVQKFIETNATHQPLKQWGRGVIGYADLPGGLGYLRLGAFDGYADGGFEPNAAELDRALDEIFTASRTSGPDRLRGLILDVRINLGGYDALGLRLASRLTGRPYLAYAKQARNSPGDPSGFTRPQPVPVRPASAPVYTGPVAMLTSSLTISAGETFTQAMTGRTPRPERIGENTQGAFSDFLWRKLPNGWSFALPNERFLTRDGTSFDVTGIPPHLSVPGVLSDEELAGDHDAAFAKALSYLAAHLVYDRHNRAQQQQILTDRFSDMGWHTPQLLAAMPTRTTSSSTRSARSTCRTTPAATSPCSATPPTAAPRSPAMAPPWRWSVRTCWPANWPRPGASTIRLSSATRRGCART